MLPKLDFKTGIPDPYKTIVVIPAMISSRTDVDSLVNQLELHYLRNSEPGLIFALLTDFVDAETEFLPTEDSLIQYAFSAIETLNNKYSIASPLKKTRTKKAGIQQSAGNLFYFLHRKRLWNPSERKWIGWERKRGKLHELNLLLRGGTDLTFIPQSLDQVAHGKIQNLVRNVITLDADTILSRGAACRLAGTLAHPLNQAIFDEKTGRVVSGYTVLQPRMEIHPKSVNHSWFTRFFAGDAGLDLYTLSVSDAYQDLFGEGSYVGKGIYEIDAFEKSIRGHIPENTVLSHDLLEGILGRAGLVTDITMVEDYPQSYIIQAMRQRRWIRGDWQLLPFLFRARRFGLNLSGIDRWKMLDNLRRSLLSPSLFLIFTIGIFFFPELTWLWTSVVLISLAMPMITSLVHSGLHFLGGRGVKSAFRPLWWNLLRWMLAVTFLPYESYLSMDAIFTSFYRMLISRRNLLEWTTAAQSAKVFGINNRRNIAWQKMIVNMGAASLLATVVILLSNISSTNVILVLVYSSPLLILWLVSPYIAWWINQPITAREVPLTSEQNRLLRQLSRRTWAFFERFVGPEDHWLPPDHFQEDPVGMIAHRTSPTNIGMLFTSTLAAYDFGYLDLHGLATRLTTTMETLDQMERYRGHFLNWYDTLTLQPLQPRYVSTVDSGNLAASLIVTARACRTMPKEPVFRWDLWQGYLDTLANLDEILSGLRTGKFENQVEGVSHQLAKIRTEILNIRNLPERWYPLYLKISGAFWQDLSKRLMELVVTGQSVFNLKSLEKLQEVAAQIERHHLSIQRILNDVVPWIPLLENRPEFLKQSQFKMMMNALISRLPYNVSLSQIHYRIEGAQTNIQLLRDQLLEIELVNKNDTDHDFSPLKAGVDWLGELERSLARADENASVLANNFDQIRIQAEKFINEMDFTFLYHNQRRVFHIGYNLDAGQLDNNFYDLLASEARIASIITIAKGQVPQSHWMQLSRPVTQVDGLYVLLSWSGTMFEYLMPHLFLHSYPGTLLADSARGAVALQKSYGKEKGVPWGISESGFYRFDTNQNYQYRAFGVPGLGFKRGLADDLVIAPYASLMAISYDPHAVTENLVELVKRKMMGVYGIYESIDFTSDRLLLHTRSAPVREYLAHHQGMILMAMDNFFNDSIMTRRMHSDPQIQSVELLLQEQVPHDVPPQDPYAEDVKGVMRLATVTEEIAPWSVPVQSSIPQVNLLSNGTYNVLISNMGGGFSSWRGVDLTRWQPDGVMDPWGTWIYIQDMDADLQKKGKLWSVAYQPIPGDTSAMQVTYYAHMAVFRRTENGITSTMEITVAPDDPVEIRHIHLHNNDERPHHLRLTSYGEVILTAQKDDNRHPAFNKLFIESEFIPDFNLQIYKRRLRSDEDQVVYLGHMLVAKGINETAKHEADRYQFIGRGHTSRNPAALTSAQYLGGTTGATLDPIFALGQEITLDPHTNTDLAFMTIAGESREAILALAERYRAWSVIEHSFRQADIATLAWLGNQKVTTENLTNYMQLLSSLIYSLKDVRAPAETIMTNKLGQSSLWRFGISGDFPILLIELDDSRQIDLVREAIQVHKFLRNRQFKLDIVLLNRQMTDYGAELNGLLYRVVTNDGGEELLNQRGGIFIILADQIKSDELVLLKTAARVLLTGDKGSITDQMLGYSTPVRHLPEFTASRPVVDEVNAANPPLAIPIQSKSELQFHNGFGGFSADGREYIIDWKAVGHQKKEEPVDRNTPAPWVNVIGYPEFGFMVSESGSQCTWAADSSENRLTPWSNDPVKDPSGEALYLRDEETGEVWSPTPLPAGSPQPYRVTHGAGYSIFEHNSHGLRQVLTLFASPEDPVKIIHLKIENTLDRTRRITATQYVEWVLGTTHADNMAFIIPEYDPTLSCLMASNPYNSEFGSHVAFLIASKKLHGFTGDRTEFLGRGGNPEFPAALHRLGLESRITPGEDPCAVLQLHLDLLPGGTEEIYFVLGQGVDKNHALALAKKYHKPSYVGEAFERTKVFWDQLLETVQVHTPQPATDLILNRWLLYQTLSCRTWGRTAFYQSSGAFGFRDQLQDVLAFLSVDPAITRNQILNASRRQFEEGDVLHWWHQPSGRGIRTRFSDDLLWLPYVVALYIEVTGDSDILNEQVPFLTAPVLSKKEIERYSEFSSTVQSFSIMEHCLRAIKKGITKGVHGLPLIGTGDWNDGLNRVGEKGKGESVWLAWFLCDVLKRFAHVCEITGDAETARSYRSLAGRYAAAIERSSWDGEWYRRGYYDNGETLGSRDNLECQIDAISQSWSVLSGAGEKKRSKQAMQASLDHLVLSNNRLSMLLNPPFDKSIQDPGYIKGYPPGIRENGGQYTHAATWTAWAFTMMGNGEQAMRLFDLLNPIFLSDTPDKVSNYRVEPYVICADIYSNPTSFGRGGWTWYTGSAAWMFRLGLEAILGFKKVGNTLKIDPVIPPTWEGFEIRYRYGESIYLIQVHNPNHVARGVLKLLVDGQMKNNYSLTLVNDKQEHKVDVTMGNIG